LQWNTRALGAEQLQGSASYILVQCSLDAPAEAQATLLEGTAASLCSTISMKHRANELLGQGYHILGVTGKL
jgi:hypothetical protein